MVAELENLGGSRSGREGRLRMGTALAAVRFLAAALPLMPTKAELCMGSLHRFERAAKEASIEGGATR